MTTIQPEPSARRALTALARQAGLPNVFSALLLLIFLAIWLRPLADLDFMWQVRTGGEIVQGKSLHIEDHFTYTISGKHLPDFEWLYEVVLWGVWSLAGFGGLHLLKVLCVLTPLVLAGWRLRREGVGWHAVFLLLAIAVLVFMPAWNLRPFYLTTIGLLLLSGWLQDHCQGRRPLSWETPLLMLIWGNTHPGVITGQGLLVGSIAWEWLNRWVKLNTPLQSAACWRLTIFGGLGVVASLICPDPVLRLQYTFDPALRHPVMKGFVELQPLHFFAFQPPFRAALIYPVTAIVLVSVLRRFREYRLWQLALLAGTAFLGSFAFRAAQDFLLIWLTVGWPHVVRMYREAGKLRLPSRLWWIERASKRVFSSPAFRFQTVWAVVLVGVLAIISLAGLRPGPDGTDWPTKALDAIEREGLKGNFFADVNTGSYLVWRLGPERARCYADTRGFFFPPEMLEDCVDIFTAEGDWKGRLRRILDRGTNYVLAPVQGDFGTLWRMMDGKVQVIHVDELLAVINADEVRKWLGQH